MGIKLPYKFRWWYIAAVLIVAVVPVLFGWIIRTINPETAVANAQIELLSSVLFSVLLTAVLFLSNSLILRYSALRFPWEENKIIPRISVSFLGTVFTAALITMGLTFLWISIFGKHYDEENFTLQEIFFQNVLIAVILTIIISALAEGRELFIMWKNQLVEAEKLKQENLEAQLAFLKNQINPHFLFNSLNSIFFLIKKDAGRAQDTLMKFSDILSHQLYQANEEKIELSKELAFIENFIELEKIRQGEIVTIDLDYDKTEIDDFIVPPILFTTFIENAFKHGLNSGFDTYRIVISIKAQGEYLVFCCNNPYRDGVQQKKESGIGLKNAKRRLELLYKNRYELTIKQENNLFDVYLKIPAEKFTHET